MFSNSVIKKPLPTNTATDALNYFDELYLEWDDDYSDREKKMFVSIRELIGLGRGLIVAVEAVSSDRPAVRFYTAAAEDKTS